MASNNGGEGGKNERRRRIAERGSDRMALITGRINALPPTPPSTTSSSPTLRGHQPRHGQSLSVSAFDSHPDDGHPLPPRHSRPHSLAAFSNDFHEDYAGGAEEKHDASISSSRLKHQGGFKYSKFDNFDVKSEEEPLTQDYDHSDTIKEVNRIQVSNKGNGAKTKPSSLETTQPPKKPCWHRHTFFSSRELNFCILASENTRALSSLIIAVLVVLCYMVSESVLASRPLYMVLLTDVTIVLAHLYQKGRVLEETDQRGEKGEVHGDRQSWGDAVKLLERGLVAYQAIRGVFIDCSIYLVVVVCGTSLM